jgi:tetratricopeptide (TPR) repeat protein
MQNVAKISRFLIDFSSERELGDSVIAASHSKLLQHVVANQLAYAANSRHLFGSLTKESIRIAEHSFGLRDVASLHEASLVLLNLPMAEARTIGEYYHALAVRRGGKIDESLPLLEAVADSAPLAYRARALQTLGAIHHAKGRLDETLRLYPEAMRAASLEGGCDLLITLMVSLDFAGIKSEMGDHYGALADYESLSPLVQIVARQNPLYFYLYHNELAIEFAELGRLAEAEAASAIALASPFAHAYPEWSATRDEIAAKRHCASPSVVAIHRAPKAGVAPRAESQRKPKRSRALTSHCRASKRVSFQRSIIPIPITVTSALNAVSIAVRIMDRVLICIGPRAPPTLS